MISVTQKTSNFFHPSACTGTHLFCYPASPACARAQMSRPDLQGHTPSSHAPSHQANWNGLCKPPPRLWTTTRFWFFPLSFPRSPSHTFSPPRPAPEGAPRAPRGCGVVSREARARCHGSSRPARLGAVRRAAGAGTVCPAGRPPEPGGDSLGDSLLRQADRAPSSPRAGACAPPGTERGV